MSVFTDTSALYALLVETEEGHSDCVAAFKRLLKSGRALHTTSYVLVETAALLQHRIGLAAVRDFFEGVVPLLTVGWVGADLHQKGLERLLRENRRQLSLVDCVSLECMRLLDLREALALDSHFAEAGYRLVPGLR